MRGGREDDDRAEGVREFVRLVGMRFGGVGEADEDGGGEDAMVL